MKAFAVILVIAALALQYRVWIADGGMREVWRLRQEVSVQRAENAKLQDRNRTLTAEVQDLKKGKTAVEERARTDLGMIGAKESFYQIVPGGSAPQANTTSAARVSK